MKRSVVLVLSILLCSARAQAQLCQPLNDEYVTESSTNPAVSILWNWPLGLMPGFPATMLTVAWSDDIESPTSFNQNDNSTSVKGADGDWYTFTVKKPLMVAGTQGAAPLQFGGYSNQIYISAHGRPGDVVNCGAKPQESGLLTPSQYAGTLSQGNIPDPDNDPTLWVCDTDTTLSGGAPICSAQVFQRKHAPVNKQLASCTGDVCAGTKPGSCALFNFPNDNTPACICFPYGQAGSYQTSNLNGSYQGMIFFDNSPGEHWVEYRHTSNSSNTKFDNHFPIYAQTSDGQCSSTPLAGTYIASVDTITERGAIADGSFGACSYLGFKKGCYPCYTGTGATATKEIMSGNPPSSYVMPLNFSDNLYGFYADGHPVGPSNQLITGTSQGECGNN